MNKFIVIGTIEHCNNARKKFWSEAYKICQSGLYTPEGKTKKIKELKATYDKVITKSIAELEQGFNDLIYRITTKEQQEQNARNTSLEYQQMIATKATILKAAIGGMSDAEVREYVKEFENDPAAISIFNAICSEYAKNSMPKEKHKLGRGFTGVLPRCKYGDRAKEWEKRKRSVLALLEKMNIKNYVVDLHANRTGALNFNAIVSAVNDSHIDASCNYIIKHIKEYWRENE